jgi:aldose sugar dehydrogenase
MKPDTADFRSRARSRLPLLPGSVHASRRRLQPRTVAPGPVLGWALGVAAALAIGLAPQAAQAQAGVTISVAPVMDNLRSPWDIAFAPDGAMLFTEKCHGLSVRLTDGSVKRLVGKGNDYPLRADDLFCQGQSGVHGVAVDPAFAQGQRHLYLFSASNLSTNPRTNRVIRVTVNEDWTAVADRNDIVTDIAFKETGAVGSAGAHSGGRLRFGPDGYLWITTGDNHAGDLPQHPTRLGGKVLRVDRNGQPAAGNNAPAGFDPRIYSYGHRNPQGISFRPARFAGAGSAFTAEHGPNHSDEVRMLVAGGNAGWDPRDRPNLNCPGNYCGYAGNVNTMPMTDTQRFPDAVLPSWNNNARSEGMGPAEFLDGPQWGPWNGRLAVSLMRARRLDVLTLDAAGRTTEALTVQIPALRLRSLAQGPDGALWASTDNGEVLRLIPRQGAR